MIDGVRRGGRHGGRLAVAREAREVAVVFFFDTDKVSVGAVSFFRLTTPTDGIAHRLYL